MPKDMNNKPDEFALDAQKLRANLDRILAKKKTSSEKSSQLGKYRKGVVDEMGCHKDSLSICERIHTMSPEEKGDFLRSFQPMFEALLPQWTEEFTDMVDKANAQSDEMAGAMD